MRRLRVHAELADASERVERERLEGDEPAEESVRFRRESRRRRVRVREPLRADVAGEKQAGVVRVAARRRRCDGVGDDSTVERDAEREGRHPASTRGDS